jgi:hypothetical protein
MKARHTVRVCTIALCAGIAFAAHAEIHADRPGAAFDGLNGGADTVARRIVVNGIGTLGRSWTVREDLQSFAARAIATSKLGHPTHAPRSRLDAGSLTLVQIIPLAAGDKRLDRAIAHVMMAHPGTRRGETSVWVADIPVSDMLEQARASLHGVAPGRDHPVLGPIAGAQRVNVVEVVDHGYSYSAVYLASGAPGEVMSGLLAQLTARGAHLDGRSANDSDARAALSMHGGRIDFSVIRNPDMQGSRIVIQTDIPPKT